MKWLALIACLFITTSAGARIDDPVDESKPELVKAYLFMPCELLTKSYAFQYEELKHLYDHLLNCRQEAEDNPEFVYGKVMCLYVQMQWQYMYDHIKSINKAWQLMCYDDDTRKTPEYEIDF